MFAAESSAGEASDVIGVVQRDHLWRESESECHMRSTQQPSNAAEKQQQNGLPQKESRALARCSAFHGQPISTQNYHITQTFLKRVASSKMSSAPPELEVELLRPAESIELRRSQLRESVEKRRLKRFELPKTATTTVKTHSRISL